MTGFANYSLMFLDGLSSIIPSEPEKTPDQRCKGWGAWHGSAVARSKTKLGHRMDHMLFVLRILTALKRCR